MTSTITATAWVPRGHAAAYPTKYVFDEDEYARISKLAKLELEDAKEDLEKARAALDNGVQDTKSGKGPGHSKSADGDIQAADHEEDEDDDAEDAKLEDDDDLREYDMENYDSEPDIPDGTDDEDEPQSAAFGSLKSLAYHADNKDDPYITLPEGEVSDDEERDELQVLPTDNLVLAARVEDEVAHLEVYVYEDDATNLYVHHDVMLPAVPLCVEWLGTKIGNVSNREDGGGNFAAVGTMDPDIELWDLDIVDCMYPNAVLGQNNQGVGSHPAIETLGGGKKKKKKHRAKLINSAYHIDAVLALAANRQHRNLLASGSADTTVKLWDLNTCTAAHSYTHHTDKVCALAWHPNQTAALLTGSYDRTVAAVDMRAPTATVPRWTVAADVEQVRWDPHVEHNFYVSTEDGILSCFDARSLPSSGSSELSKPIWRLQAHEKSLSAFSLNPTVPGFIATGSTDRTVKLWNISPDAAGPSMVVSRDLGVGKVFSTNFAPDDEVAFRLAVAGSKGAVQVWDTSTNKAVREAFAGRVKAPDLEKEGEERLIGIGADESDEEDDEEEEDDDVESGANGNDGGWESMDED